MFYLTSLTADGEVIQTSSSQHEWSIAGGRHPDAFDTVDSEAPPNSYWSFAASEWVTKPAQPSAIHQWDVVNKAWVDPRTLAQIKATQWIAIKESRAAALVTPLTTPYGPFDATASGQKSITDAILLLQTMASLGTPTTIDFTLADNTTTTLDTTQMVTVGLLLGQRTQTIYAHGRIRREAIDAATTAAEVEAVVW